MGLKQAVSLRTAEIGIGAKAVQAGFVIYFTKSGFDGIPRTPDPGRSSRSTDQQPIRIRPEKDSLATDLTPTTSRGSRSSKPCVNGDRCFEASQVVLPGDLDCAQRLGHRGQHLDVEQPESALNEMFHQEYQSHL